MRLAYNELTKLLPPISKRESTSMVARLPRTVREAPGRNGEIVRRTRVATRLCINTPASQGHQDLGIQRAQKFHDCMIAVRRNEKTGRGWWSSIGSKYSGFWPGKSKRDDGLVSVRNNQA